VSHDSHQHQGDGLGKIESVSRGAQDLSGVVQIGLDEVGGAFRCAMQQRTGVRHDLRVMIHVDDARLRGNALSDLVRVLDGGQAGTDVEELPQAGLVS
jgi:hypothetical protein